MKNLEQYEKMHREVETLGNAGNYHGQAQAFLAGTGAIIEARFSGMRAGQFGPDDKEPRDVWEIRISRNGRAYTFMYGASIKDTEERLERIAGPQRAYSGAYYRTGRAGSSPTSQAKHTKWEKIASQWTRLETVDAMSINAPHAYDILSGLTKNEPPREVDEFAAEYGYTKISEAVRIHKAVQEEYQEMRALFDNDELETMGLIS